MATNPLGAVNISGLAGQNQKKKAQWVPPPPDTNRQYWGKPPDVKWQRGDPNKPMFGSAGDLVRRNKQNYADASGEINPMFYGVAQGVGDFIDTATTPNSIAALAALTTGGLLPATVMRLLGLGYSMYSLWDMSKKVPEAVKEFNNNNDAEGYRIATGAGIDLGMAAAGVYGAHREIASANRQLANSDLMGGLAQAAKGDLSGARAGQEGFMTIEYHGPGGNLIGKEDIQGPMSVRRTFPDESIMERGMPPGTRADIIVRRPPQGNAGLEGGRALKAAEMAGVSPSNTFYREELGGGPRPISTSEFLQKYTRGAGSITEPHPEKGTLKEQVSAGLGPLRPDSSKLPRTASGKISYASRPRQRAEISMEAEPEPKAPPKVLPEPQTTYVNPSEESYRPAYPNAGKSLEPTMPAEPPIPPQQSVLEQTLAALIEQNKLMRQYIDMRLGGAEPTMPKAAEPTPKGGPKISLEEFRAQQAAQKPAVPETDLAKDIQDIVSKPAAGADLTAAERGGGPKKKGPESFVGKTIAEKYASKEPAASAKDATPKTIHEFEDAVGALEAGTGKPVNVTIRGLGDAKPRSGQILYRVKDARGNPTGRYAFMPEGYSGDPYSIPIDDIFPVGTKVHEMNVPRFAQRSYDLGYEVSVPGRASRLKGERVVAPDGRIGTKVEEVISGKKEIQWFMKNLQEKAAAGDETAAARYNMFKSKLESKGFPKLARVAMDDGRWYDFVPDELKPAPELEPTTTTPAKGIKPATAKSLKEVETRMTEAGGERGKPAPEISNENAISAEAIMKATGRKPQEPTLSLVQIQSRIRGLESEIPSELQRAFTLQNTQPQEATAIRTRVGNLQKELKSLKERLKVAPPIPPPPSNK